MERKYFYTYEIYIDDEEHYLNGCYYYGKCTTSNLNSEYWGSGKVINQYKKQRGTNHLIKKILNLYDSEIELCNAERELIESKIKELGNKCLNMRVTSGGGWSSINLELSHNPNQRHYNALCGGLAHKKKLTDPENLKKFSEIQKLAHKNETPENKQKRYFKVSKSLSEYHMKNKDTDKFKQTIIKNKQTNIEVSKKWRSEFFSLFNNTPEYFRKFGLMGESLKVFKQIRNLTEEEKIREVNRFMEKVNR